MTIKIKKLSPDAKLPIRGSREAAGYDLCACMSAPVTILPEETAVIGSGLAMEIPPGWFGQLHGRSGLAVKRGLSLATGVSVIDSDYRGEVMVGLRNGSDHCQVIYPGDRIAQIVIQKHPVIEWSEADRLSESERGDGGFGSSGR